VEAILEHKGNPAKRSSLLFLVRWLGFDPEDDTWETYTNLKDVGVFQEYCKLHPELKIKVG
jgi:hypothetical protein